MRVVVVGTSGSGKTTMARRLSEALCAPRIELDAINWQAGWRDLNTHDPEEFFRRVAEAAAGEAWIADGNYSKVREALWPQATHFVWLDYDRSVIMPRVIWRSLPRAIGGRELWEGTGNTESLRRWFDPGIRSAGPGTPGRATGRGTSRPSPFRSTRRARCIACAGPERPSL